MLDTNTSPKEQRHRKWSCPKLGLSFSKEQKSFINILGKRYWCGINQGKDYRKSVKVVQAHTKKAIGSTSEESRFHDFSPMKKGRKKPRALKEVLKRDFIVNKISKDLIFKPNDIV